MIIRFATEQDIPGMIALLRQVGQVHHNIRPDIFPPHTQKYDEAALKALLQNTDRPIFIADEDGVVAGYCFCEVRKYGNSAVSVARTELYIDDLCVDEGHQRRGIASALYRHACGYARVLGCGSLTLNVWCGNEGAMAFYEGMGLRKRNIMMEIPLEDTQC